MCYRDKLVADRASYEARIGELRGQLGEKLPAQIIASSEYIIEVMDVEIKEAKQAIEKLIESDNGLKVNYDLVQSVQGIGFVTAVHMLIVTENFSRFSNPRKFACYAGVAPFEHSSGSSIRGRTKVSHLANKKIKSLLTLQPICPVN